MPQKIISLNSIPENENFTPKVQPHPDEVLKKIYNEIYTDSKPKILEQAFLKSIQDKKYEAMRGLTLIINLGDLNSKPLQKLMTNLQKKEPNQTYNKPQNFHHTCFVFAFFDQSKQKDILTPEFVEKCKLAIEKALTNFPEFPFQIKGITASSNTIMAQGYSKGKIQELRTRITTELKAQGITASKQSQLNHISLARLTSPLNAAENLVKTIEKNRSTSLGKTQVKSLKLVVNNYFNEPEHSTVLAEYKLQKSK